MYNNFCGNTGGLNFAGDTQDSFAGLLYDTPNRDLHPGQGRWLSPDPSGISAVDLTNPQSWNPYAYVMNNPLSNIDPTGLDNSCTNPKVLALCQAGDSTPYGGSLPSIYVGWTSGWDFAESLEYPIQVNTVTYIYHPPTLIVGPQLYDTDGNPISIYNVWKTIGGWSTTTATTDYMYGIAANNVPPGAPGVPPNPQAIQRSMLQMFWKPALGYVCGRSVASPVLKQTRNVCHHWCRTGSLQWICFR